MPKKLHTNIDNEVYLLGKLMMTLGSVLDGSMLAISDANMEFFKCYYHHMFRHHSYTADRRNSR